MTQELQKIVLPLYQCHKRVNALKIAEIHIGIDDTGEAIIVPENNAYGIFRVSRAYMEKHQPQVGGYWVKYEEGYESWSPADVFEAGYNLVAVSPLTVSFKTDLAPSGDLNRVHLSKDGVTISLTIEQAKSLAMQVAERMR